VSAVIPVLRAIVIALIVAAVGAIALEDRLPPRLPMVIFGLLVMAVGIERLLRPARIAQEQSRMPLNFMAPLARSPAGPFYLRISGIFLFLLGLAFVLFAIAEQLTQ
jgi:uncharacterized membrane protein YfcA